MKAPNWQAIEQPTEGVIAFADIEQPRALLLQGEFSGRIYRREYESGRWEVAELRPALWRRIWHAAKR